MKNVLATILGLIVASGMVFIFETLIGQNLFPLPEGANPMDMEWIKNNMHLIPTGAKAFVIIAHFMGIVSGMFVAALISKTSMVPSYIVGGFMLAATLFNIIMIPSDFWFRAADGLFAFLGFLIGLQLAKSKIKV